MWGCFLMSGVKILHFLKDWRKSIPIHQNYTMALSHARVSQLLNIPSQISSLLQCKLFMTTHCAITPSAPSASMAWEKSWSRASCSLSLPTLYSTFSVSSWSGPPAWSWLRPRNPPVKKAKFYQKINPFSTGTGWPLYKVYGGFRISYGTG